MTKKDIRDIAIGILLVFGGLVAVELTGGINWAQFFLMVGGACGGMLLLIFLEWFFIVRPHGPNGKNHKDCKEEEPEPAEGCKIIKFEPKRYDMANNRKTTLYSEQDTCVMCGRYVPEGTLICPSCEKDC